MKRIQPLDFTELTIVVNGVKHTWFKCEKMGYNEIVGLAGMSAEDRTISVRFHDAENDSYHGIVLPTGGKMQVFDGEIFDVVAGIGLPTQPVTEFSEKVVVSCSACRSTDPKTPRVVEIDGVSQFCTDFFHGGK